MLNRNYVMMSTIEAEEITEKSKPYVLTYKPDDEMYAKRGNIRIGFPPHKGSLVRSNRHNVNIYQSNSYILECERG